MASNVHLRFLGVFQPGPQIGQDLPCLDPRSKFTGLHRLAQSHDHLTDGPQLLRNGSALLVERVALFVCSDQYHPNLCLLC
ncbi:hypothetical protein SAMN05443551_1835 [Marivita hallyeonensis]|uniref:Uncharacterized protein n=1 Tax=Marivita hallyeonensis TaxID=996342 RepID=A0A1M5RPS5_9RHOB|nr:hypothetical protein SAMN05443551_1835 [Marivita hallyeonensis]